MKNETIFIKLKPELKTKIKDICVLQKRTITGFLLLLIEEKLQEIENGTKKK